MSALDPTPFATADAIAERLMEAKVVSMELATVVLGDRLNLYRQILALGPVSASALSAATNLDQRYLREWLEQQAVSGFLQASDNPSDDLRTYSLNEAQAEAFTDRDSLAFAIPMAQQALGYSYPLDQLTDCFSSGEGISFGAYGVDTRDGIGLANRSAFINLLGSEWFPAIPKLHARLSDSGNPAKVADIGSGTGWSSISIAQAYPAVTLDGVDADQSSVDLARRNAIEAGVADRVTFHLANAASSPIAGSYDLVCAFECIHDMADPVSALAWMRHLVNDSGTVLVVDERTPDAFGAPGTLIDRYLYTASVLHCLPASRSESPSAATGTIIRSHILAEYAHQAGYARTEILDIDHPFWKFYQLHTS